jgi:hypothetical protein
MRVNAQTTLTASTVRRALHLTVATTALVAAALTGTACSRSEPSPKPETSKLQPLPATEKKAKKPKKKPKPQWPAAIPGTLLVDPQRPLEGATTAGWQTTNEDGRTVARLTEPKATVQFALAPVPGDYVLTGVARAKGAKSTKLTPTLNGKALPAWNVTDEWSMYTSKVPKDLLGAEKDELALAAGTAKEPAAIELDSVALLPVTDRATIELGAPLGGHLIDGFYRVERGKVRWSRGKKSLLGVVLAPGKGPYTLEIQGSGFPPISPVSTTVTINGKPVGSASFAKKFGAATWEIPAGVLLSGLNRIELSYEKSGQPKAFGKSEDDRDIAVRIERVIISPKG